MAGIKESRRIWLPFVLAALCLVVSNFTGPAATVVALVAALCLAVDGGTKWFARTGGLSQHRQ